MTNKEVLKFIIQARETGVGTFQLLVNDDMLETIQEALEKQILNEAKGTECKY